LTDRPLASHPGWRITQWYECPCKAPT